MERQSIHTQNYTKIYTKPMGDDDYYVVSKDDPSLYDILDRIQITFYLL
jgi:hypothetical protein